MALLVAAYLVLGYFAFLLLYPFETIVVHNEPFPIKNAPVTAGKIVIYTVDYCRYTDVDAEVTRTLVGSVSISLGKTDAHFPRGCAIKDVADSIIPSFAPPGHYYIQIDSNYKINKLRSIEKHFRTATFDVVAPPPTQAIAPPAIDNNTTGYVPPQPSSSNPTPVSSTPANQQVATTSPPPKSTPPPKQTPPPVSTPPTTSGPPPDDHPGTINRVVNGVLAPVNGVLNGVESILHP